MARTPRPSQSAGEPSPFESPPGGSPSGTTEGNQFEPPPDTSAPQETGPEEMDFAAGNEADPELHQMKRELEQLIFARPASAAAASDLGGGGRPDPIDLITGVGIGPAHRDFESVGPAGPGVPVLNVYVAERMSMDEAKSVLVDSFGVR